MMHRKRSKATFIIIVTVMLVLAVIDYVQRARRSPINQFDLARATGDPAAAVQIVEFMDFQCHECARGYALLNEYLEVYPDEIFLQQRYFPLSGFNSFQSALNAQCAAEQGAFWALHDRLIETQGQWRTVGQPQPFFSQLAEKAGLQMDEFNACLGQEGPKETILVEQAAGEAMFVKMTPTYFINGKMTVGVSALTEALRKYFRQR